MVPVRHTLQLLYTPSMPSLIIGRCSCGFWYGLHWSCLGDTYAEFTEHLKVAPRDEEVRRKYLFTKRAGKRK